MKLAFWRTPKDERPDPDVTMRMAENRVARIEFIAAEHKRLSEEIRERREDNHISEAVEAWFGSTRHRPPRKMPPRKAS